MFAFKSRYARSRVDVILSHMREVGGRFAYASDFENESGFKVRFEYWTTRKGIYIVKYDNDGNWDVFCSVDPHNNSIADTLGKVV